MSMRIQEKLPARASAVQPTMVHGDGATKRKGAHRRMPVWIAVAPCFTLRDAEHDERHVVPGVAGLPRMTSAAAAVPESTRLLF
jgi:hypothetical protein